MQRNWLIAGAGAALGLFAYRLWRVAPLNQVPEASPESTYASAMARAARLQQRDGEQIQTACRTRLLTHGHKTAHSIVLLHGFTNCPLQYAQLDARLFNAGYNVIAPRYPYHGHDRLSSDIANLKAEQLVAVTAEAVDIAGGLGETVTVLGLSLGGILATWVALNRADVHHAVVVSPAYGAQAVDGDLRSRVMANLLQIVPGFFRWWDPELKERTPIPPHIYPRISSRAFGQLLRLGRLVFYAAKSGNPVAPLVTMVLNPCDDAVDNSVTEQILAVWRSRNVGVNRYDFAATLNLIHDIIDPTQAEEQVAIVYPVIEELICTPAREVETPA